MWFARSTATFTIINAQFYSEQLNCFLTHVKWRNEIRWGPGKRQVWRSHVLTWGLSEANVLYWRKCMWYWWGFLAPSPVICHPSGIRRPKVIQRPGISTPLPFSLIPCTCLVLRRKFYYFTRFPRGFESMKKHWFSKSAFKTLEKYWIWPKRTYSNEKVWKFQI